MNAVALLAGLVQAATAPPSAAIDLAAPRRCTEASIYNDEVVVCGRRDSGRSPYRLPLPGPDQSARAKAEISFGDRIGLAAETENANVGGRPSNRAMLRLKIKF